MPGRQRVEDSECHRRAWEVLSGSGRVGGDDALEVALACRGSFIETLRGAALIV